VLASKMITRPLAEVRNEAIRCWLFIVTAHRENKKHARPTKDISPPNTRVGSAGNSVPSGKSTVARAHNTTVAPVMMRYPLSPAAPSSVWYPASRSESTNLRVIG